MIAFEEEHLTVSQFMSSTSDLKSSVPDNSIEADELWEIELDLLGAAASSEALQQHLERAPNPESAAAQYLLGFLAHYDKK